LAQGSRFFLNWHDGAAFAGTTYNKTQIPRGFFTFLPRIFPGSASLQWTAKRLRLGTKHANGEAVGAE
jgi:hypothetical protein